MYLVDDMCRMRMLMAGVYVGIAISSTYGFSIFTKYLKENYHMSQSDITTISTVGNCVNYFSFPAGMLFDYAGPMVVLPLAGFFGFLGFFLFGLTFAGYISNPTVVHFSLYQGIAHIGLPALDVAALMPLMLQFPLDRGFVVIIQKAFSGLGTSVLMAYFNGWFKAADSNDVLKNDYTGYAFFVGGQVLFCSLVGTYFIRLPMYFPCTWRKRHLTEEEMAERKATLDLYMTQRAPKRRLKIGFVLIVCMLIFSATQSIATAYVETSKGGYLAISIVAVLLMASFTSLALPFQFLGAYTPVRPTEMEAIGESMAEPTTENRMMPISGSVESFVKSENNAETFAPLPQYQGNFWGHLLSIPLWGLWLACFGSWGTGAVMQMNAAQMYSSKNYGELDTPTLAMYVAIMSVGSAVGRMSAGVLDMVLTRLQRTGRTQLITTIAVPCGPLLLFVAYILFAVLPQGGLIVPFFLGSVGNGLGWGSTVLAIRMMYARDVGKHYDFMFSSGVVASIALNRFMFGEMYDSEGRKRGTYPECDHPNCINTQMWILMAVNVLATFGGGIVHWRYSKFIQEERLKELAAHAMMRPSADEIAAQASLQDSDTVPDQCETEVPVQNVEQQEEEKEAKAFTPLN